MTQAEAIAKAMAILQPYSRMHIRLRQQLQAQFAVALQAAADEAEGLARAEVRKFATAVLHGDDEHRAWLMEAAEAWERGDPVPPVRSGRTIAENLDIIGKDFRR